MIDQDTPAADVRTRRAARRARRAPRMRLILVGAVAVALLASAGIVTVATMTAPPALHEVRAAGVEFTTNVEVREERGSVYVYLPVNTDVASVVLGVEDPSTSERIRAFLDGIDTLVPGEHVLDLEGVSVRVIVDGIPDQE